MSKLDDALDRLCDAMETECARLGIPYEYGWQAYHVARELLEQEYERCRASERLGQEIWRHP